VNFRIDYEIDRMGSKRARRNELKDNILNKYLEAEKMSNEEAIRLYKTGKSNVLKVMKVMLVENLKEETEVKPIARSKREKAEKKEQPSS
jgi:hypothetical protein